MSNHNNNSNFSPAEIKASHEELRKACVDSIKQSIGRFEKSEISLSGTSNFQGITHRAFGAAGGSGSAAVMGQWRTFVDEYGANQCCPPAFVPGKTKKWPLPIADALQGIATGNTKCGVFPQMSRTWVVVDNKILLWHYGTDDVTQIQPFSENIVAVHLAEPRKGVFLPTIQYILVVSTPTEVHFVGMSSHDGGDLAGNSDLVAIEMNDYTITKTPSTFTCITSHRRTGRIFCGATDGFLYEIIYSGTDGIIRSRMSLANRSIYFGGTAVVSSVGRAIASFRQTWVRANSPLIDVVCSDDARGTMFALSAGGRIETWTIEEEDLYSASSIVNSAGSGSEEPVADGGSIMFQCFAEHGAALQAYLQEPSRRQAGGGANAGATVNTGGNNNNNIIPLVSLHLPARSVAGFASSSNSASSSSTGTIIAVDASGARYYYNASASFSMYAYSQTLELKLNRREAPLRFADGAETGSRNLRCCAVGGESGGAFCAVYENEVARRDDVITLAGPNLLPFSGVQSPSEVVSMFTHQPSRNNNSSGSNNNNNNTIKVMGVADCAVSGQTETGRTRRQFIILHNEGISFVSSLRPVDMVHCALLASPRLQNILFQRIQAVASPADVAYLLIQLMTSSSAATNAKNSYLSNFRTSIFKGSTFSATAPASPTTADGAAAAAANNINKNSAYYRLDEGRIASFEDALLDRLANGGGAPSPAVTQTAFEILKTLANPMEMRDSHNATESNLTVTFSPLSGGLVSAIGQAIMTIYKSAPTQVGSQGTKGEKAKFVKNLTAAVKQLQAILDIMNRMKINNNSDNTMSSSPSFTPMNNNNNNNNNANIWSPIESDTTIFIEPFINVSYDDSAANVNHARSCGTASLRLYIGNNNNNNNNSYNSNGQYHRGFNVAPPLTNLTAQHGHRLHIARIAYLYKICDFARQIAYFWKRGMESVAPSIIHQVSGRLGGVNSTCLEMLYRKADATSASRTLIRVLLAEERNALVPNVAMWNDLLADFERACPELYNVSDSLESRATLDIQRLVRAGTEQHADRSGVDQTLTALAQQANTMWKAGSLEPICWQLHKSGCSVDAVVLLLRAAARLDSARTNQSCVVAIRAVTEGYIEAGANAPDSFKDKLRALDTLHSLLEDIRRIDESTFDLFFDSSRTGLNVPPGWNIWEVEPQDRASHMSILSWLAAPRDDRTVSRKLRAHVTGVYGGRAQSSSSPFLKDFFELQSKLNQNGANNNNNNNGNDSNNSNNQSSVFPTVSVETARYQWHTKRNHADAVTTFVAVSQTEMQNRPFDERLQARLDILREAKQCAREGGLDVALIDRPIQNLSNQKKLLEDMNMAMQHPGLTTSSLQERYQNYSTRLATSVLETEELFRIANELPGGAGFDVQLIILESNAVEDSTLYSQVLDRVFNCRGGSIYNTMDAARICLQHFKAAVFPIDVVIMYVEAYLSSSSSSNNNNNNNSNNLITYNNFNSGASGSSSACTSGVDLLNDAGVNTKRVFDEYMKLAKFLHNKGVGVSTSSSTATKIFLNKVSISQVVFAAAEALKRHVVIARPQPSATEVKEYVENLRKFLNSNNSNNNSSGDSQQQQFLCSNAERSLVAISSLFA